MINTETEAYDDPFATEERRALAETARRFTAEHITDRHDQFERDGRLPRDLHTAAAAAGLLGLGFPTEAGGSGGTLVDVVVRGSRPSRNDSSGPFLAVLRKVHTERILGVSLERNDPLRADVLEQPLSIQHGLQGPLLPVISDPVNFAVRTYEQPVPLDE